MESASSYGDYKGSMYEQLSTKAGSAHHQCGSLQSILVTGSILLLSVGALAKRPLGIRSAIIFTEALTRKILAARPPLAIFPSHHSLYLLAVIEAVWWHGQ
jgi:hypothetical protein